MMHHLDRFFWCILWINDSGSYDASKESIQVGIIDSLNRCIMMRVWHLVWMMHRFGKPWMNDASIRGKKVSMMHRFGKPWMNDASIQGRITDASVESIQCLNRSGTLMQRVLCMTSMHMFNALLDNFPRRINENIMTIHNYQWMIFSTKNIVIQGVNSIHLHHNKPQL